MSKIRLYYLLKPWLPLRLRLWLRRLRAGQIRQEVAGSWPISGMSGNAPAGWPGWPEGKEFALVLTHDVEGPRGLACCRELAAVEMEYGFRSSFNFIPQGSYQVPQDLLDWLRENGFEVGVHDLKHDGNLFRSRRVFEDSCPAINHYLERWQAAGFRAGFMLHELDWLHGLNIAYDASTFDVDPFEAQPDAVQTVFPFWVPRPDPEADALKREPRSSEATAGSGQGYMELPYTLVQDFNLFVVLQEKGIGIWQQKLSWLAGKGAMALLDTHPDYMAIGRLPGRFEFSVAYYQEFLEHVRTVYAGRYWHALPKDVARWGQNFRPRQARPPREVVMLTYSFYESDNRVRRYAESLVRRGDKVRVFCLGSEARVQSQQWEILHGVEIYCLQSRTKQESGKWSHAWRLGRFFLKALKHLGSRGLGGGCDLLHVHNIPDFLVFAGIRLKCRGARIILDIHDIVPELFESKFGTGRRSFLAAGLRLIEKWSCRFADHVIIANHIWKKTISSRSAPPAKVTALVNNVDLDLFFPHPRTRTDDRIILLYPGSLNRHQGLDLAIAAVQQLVAEFPEIELHIYGKGPTLPDLKEQAKSLQLQEHVHFFPEVSLDGIPGLMANADIGIVPKRAEGFGDQAYSPKIMEFMSQGLPVVLSRTRIDSLYFDDSVVAFFESGNAADLARAIRRVIRDPEYKAQLSRQGRAYADANSWEQIKEVYLDVVDRLTATGIPRPPRQTNAVSGMAAPPSVEV